MQHSFPKIRGLFTIGLLSTAVALYAQTPRVLTAEYDNERTTANNKETVLNPGNVNVASFGKVGAWALDGQVVGQPLYLPGARIGKQFVNALFVATMNNSVYALNAEQPGSAPLWKVNLGPAVPMFYAGTCPSPATGPQLGILSTPVINPGTKMIYVVAAHPVPGQPAYNHTLYALDLNSGQQKHAVLIQASVTGTGTSSVAGTISLDPTKMIQRPALLLSDHTVYVGFGSCGPDPSPYHGWVIGYDANNLKQTFVYNTTPDGDEGSVWQSGRGLVGDNSSSVYFETGNGTVDDHTDFSESFVKLSSAGGFQDFFTPSDAQNLSTLDLDLSTTSPLLAPDTNLLIGSGKQGLIYVLHADSLGGFGNAAQTFPSGAPCAATFSGCQKVHSLAYWQNAGPSQLFVWPTDDTLHAFPYQNGQFAAATSQSTATSGYPGGILTVTSAAGQSSTGIVWALTPGEFHAFSAANVANELWNSNQNASRDALNGNYHFEQFAVVGGRAYIPDAQNSLIVYGLLH